ncbi:unnamed protein product [Sphagnum balticum]
MQYQRETHELTVEIYGRDSKEAIRTREFLVSTVQKTSKTEEIQEITESNYEDSIRALDVTDEKSQKLT